MTIRDQLNRLPEPYRSLALKRAEEQPYYSMEDPSESVWCAVQGALWKFDTPEGYAFWDAVTDWARIHIDGDLPKLPPIPEE